MESGNGGDQYFCTGFIECPVFFLGPRTHTEEWSVSPYAFCLTVPKQPPEGTVREVGKNHHIHPCHPTHSRGVAVGSFVPDSKNFYRRLPPSPSKHLHATCLVGLKIPDGAWEQSRPVAIETRYYPSSMQLPSFLFPVLSLRCSDRNKSGWSTQLLPALNVHLHSHQPWGTPGTLRFLKRWGDDLISSSSDQGRSGKAMLWHHLLP